MTGARWTAGLQPCATSCSPIHVFVEVNRFKNGKPVHYYTWTPCSVSGVLVPDKDVEWQSVPASATADSKRHVDDWTCKNGDFYDSWLKAAREAAK